MHTLNTHRELKGERLYYIKDGKVQDELNINVLNGTQLKMKSTTFIDQKVDREGRIIMARCRDVYPKLKNLKMFLSSVIW